MTGVEEIKMAALAMGTAIFLITQRQLPVIKTYKEIRYSIHCNSCVFKLIFMPIIFTNDTIIIV